MALTEDTIDQPRTRLRKAARREQILLELRLQPHIRIADIAARFQVSSETVRRDLDKLSKDGLINRAHGGASVASRHYPDFNQRSRARLKEREAIGRRAASLVEPGETVLIDSGSTTVQLARFIAYNNTPCTVITNSLTVAMTLGASDAAQVILCPGDYMPSEAAVVGTDTVEFIDRLNVDRCLIGASAITGEGVSEAVRGFAAVKRVMLQSAATSHLLVDSEKFGRVGMTRVARLDEITSVVVDSIPDTALEEAMSAVGVEILVAT